ncbi:unnamed protein product, partial [Durusdinium trenchii]
VKGAQKAKQAKQEADGAAGPESDGCLGEKHMFQTFNLQELGVPAQAIEVLCKTRAFVVKRVGGHVEGQTSKGQVSWSKFPTVQAAWEAAKLRANFGG